MIQKACSLIRPLGLLLLAGLAPLAQAEECPTANIVYWQAFPPGGESDQAARHQQRVLKRQCPAIETIVQYKAGAGGALMWSQTNGLQGDGTEVVGINLPHIVMQPMEGQVHYKTDDLRPVYWFNYTPDALVVPDSSPFRNFDEFVKAAKASPGKFNIGGSGLNSANHVAHERLGAAFGIQSTYIPYKGTGEMAIAVLGSQIDAAMTFTTFAVGNKGKVRALAVAMEKRHPLLPDVPTFRELGIDWVDGAYRGIAVPKATPFEIQQRLSRRWAALNTDPEMIELATRSGFELVNVGVDQMDAFMKERTRTYTEVGRRMGLTK